MDKKRIFGNNGRLGVEKAAKRHIDRSCEVGPAPLMLRGESQGNSMNAVFRILDANFNRAREALRVMEEFARFVLSDALLTEECKRLRHDVVAVLRHAEGLEAGRQEASPGASGRGGGISSILVARDIVGDVGRDVGTEAEFCRKDAVDVAVAAGKRLSEALRAIEEYGKLLLTTPGVVGPGPPPTPELLAPDAGVKKAAFAASVEALRYRGYEVERRLAMTLRARERFAAVLLYVIITEALCSRDWFATAEAALAGGADCLQLREKDLPDRELLTRAKRLADLCRQHGKLCIVNDRADIAAATGAHGVHLGQDDLPVAAARRVLPSWAIVGKSTHTIEQVEAAAAEAPDYIAVGPMFPSGTKPQEHVPGPPLLAAARRLTSIPLVAIGGIDSGNLAQVIRAASACICVCGAVAADANPRAATEKLMQELSRGGGEGAEKKSAKTLEIR